jgi:hypothetical protein
MKRHLHGRGLAVLLPLMLLTGMLAVAEQGTGQVSEAAAPSVLLVGSWHGRSGQFPTIAAAAAAAKPGDWILVGPGDYHESPGQQTAVRITTPDVHLRGMDRNGVVVDGTRPGSPRCSSPASAQDFGPLGAGRNGIEVSETDGVSVENLTACNFLSGTGSTGNEIWWNGGDGTGQQRLGSYHGAYLTATSTYANLANTNLAQYALFVSNSFGPGDIVHSFGSNMADASYYVGACPDCNATLDQDIGTGSVLGYSGTNSGGHLLIERSVFAHNKTGIVPNSENNDDAPPPQNGACPSGTTGSLGARSCTIIRDNRVMDNNDPNVPGGGSNAYSVIGAGIVLAGGQNDTVSNNLVTGNGSWGIMATDFPFIGTPPTGIGANCQGGIPLLSNLCYFQAYGDQVSGNTLAHNGFFGNPTNGDLAEATIPHSPGNCWFGNRPPGVALTGDPARLQATQGTCGQPNGGDIVGPLGVELACATQALGSCAGSGEASVVQEIVGLAGLLGVNPSPLQQPGIDQLPVVYPTTTAAQAPYPPPQPTMPDPCAGVPSNAWCPR